MSRKIICDTETFLMGLLYAREPYDVLFDLPEGYTMLLSDVVFSEVLEVLRRSTAVKEALPAASEVSLPQIFNALDMEVVSIPSTSSLKICSDPGDNKFLASAIYLECDYLVTAVEELLRLEKNPKWLEFKRKHGIDCSIVSMEELRRIVTGGAA